MTIVYDKPNDRQNNPASDATFITIGIFMDGTSNNSYNVIARGEYVKEYRRNKKNAEYSDKARAYKKYTGDDKSYENDHTNVYRLFEAYPKTDSIKKLYIEGIGTVYKEKEEKEIDRYGSDDLFEGIGVGKGKNGIRGKVYKACEQAVALCPKDIRYITFDVFGFSRGAAAARNLVYEIMRPDGISHRVDTNDIYDNNIDSRTNSGYLQASKKVSKGGFFGFLLDKKGIDIEDVKIKIRFVGIFDTVASYDPSSMLENFIKTQFETQAKKLHMNQMLVFARRIVHLTADNEHRENFALTPVGNYLKVREHSLPGVHSDIGGGYKDSKPEQKKIALKSTVNNLQDRKEWLIKEGFFLDSQLSIQSDTLWSKRKSVSALYIRIPLKIMTDYGNIHAEGRMFDERFTNKNTSLNESNLSKLKVYKHHIQSDLHSLVLTWKEDSPQLTKKEHENKISQFTAEIDDLIAYYSDDDQNPESLKPDDDEILFYTRRVILQSIFEPEDERGLKREGMIRKTGKDIIADRVITKNIIINSLDYYAEETLKQIVLLILRHRCLHWSASFESTWGVKPHKPTYMDDKPTENGKRPIYQA